jgi:hypothetical protein
MTIPGFISYAHEDAPMCRELHKRLKPVERATNVRFWVDHGIGAGEEWKDEILKALDAAQVALFLVSPDMMASEFIWDVELPRACKRAAKGEMIVIPVILELCIWQLPMDGYCLPKLQAVPHLGAPISKHRPRGDGYHDAAERILAQLQRRFPGGLGHA